MAFKLVILVFKKTWWARHCLLNKFSEPFSPPNKATTAFELKKKKENLVGDGLDIVYLINFLSPSPPLPNKATTAFELKKKKKRKPGGR